MTTTEAIKQLQTEHDLIAGEHDLDGSQFAPALLEALAMAIEALEAQDMTLYMNLPEVSAEEVVEILKRNNRIELIPSGEDTNVPNTDTISRQATITEIKNYERDSTAPIDYEKIVEQMPSAQPELIMCKDCKFADGEATTSNGMYWCIVHGTYMRYCSDAKRRTDVDMRGEQE